MSKFHVGDLFEYHGVKYVMVNMYTVKSIDFKDDIVCYNFIELTCIENICNQDDILINHASLFIETDETLKTEDINIISENEFEIIPEVSYKIKRKMGE